MRKISNMWLRWSLAAVLAFTVAAPVSANRTKTAGVVQSGTKSDAKQVAAYRPKMGQASYYQLNSVGTAQINMEALVSRMSPAGKPVKGKLDSHKFEISALLGMRPVAQEGGDTLVVARLKDPMYIVDGQPDTRASALEADFMMRISSRGEIKAFEFPPKFPEEAVLAIRALVEPMQMVMPADSATEWTVGEKGVTGLATVNYRIDGVDDKKIKMARSVTAAKRALPGLTSGREAFRTRVEASRGDVEWARDGSGPLSISTSETTTAMQGEQLLSKSTTDFTAVRTEKSVTLPGDHNAARAALKDPRHARASFYRVPSQFEAQVTEVDFATALSYYKTNIHKAAPDTTLLMKFYLRKHPEQVVPFIDALNTASQAPESQELANLVGYGLAAMAAAGNTEAQRGLVGILESNSYTQLMKDKALDAMLSLEMPERFVPAAVWAYRESIDRSKDGYWEKLSIATNIYGQMGNVSMGVPENTDEVVTTLGRALRNGDAMEKRRALMALGNINDFERVLPLTQSFFTSSDENLRMRAYDTFLNAQGEKAFTQFAKFYAAEKNAGVRDDASVIAVQMGESEARTAWAIEQARNSDNTIIRSRAVTILGRSLETSPKNEKALRDLLTTVKDRDVRKIIYTYVAPAKRGAQ